MHEVFETHPLQAVTRRFQPGDGRKDKAVHPDTAVADELHQFAQLITVIGVGTDPGRQGIELLQEGGFVHFLKIKPRDEQELCRCQFLPFLGYPTDYLMADSESTVCNAKLPHVQNVRLWSLSRSYICLGSPS